MEHVIVIFEGQRRLIAKPPSYEVLVQLARAYFAIPSTAGLSLSYFPLVAPGNEGIDLKPNKYDDVADCTYIIISLIGQPAALSYAAAGGSVNDGQGKAESLGYDDSEDSGKGNPQYSSDLWSFGEPPERLETTVPARKAKCVSPSGSFAGGSIQGSARNSDQGNGWGGGWGRNYDLGSPKSGSYGRGPTPRSLPRSALHPARNSMPPSPRGWGASGVVVDNGWGTGSVFHSGNNQWNFGRIRDSVDHQNDRFYLNIRDPHANQCLIVDVRPFTKISKLHAAIAARRSYDVEEFYLQHGCHVLKDNLTIADYQIKNGDAVVLKFHDWGELNRWGMVGKRGKPARTEDF